MPDLTPYLYGGLAAVTAESLTFPVDTAKTRLQLQGQTVITAQWSSSRPAAFGSTSRITLLALPGLKFTARAGLGCGTGGWCTACPA